LIIPQTKEVLYLVNRPGNQPSNTEAAPWMDQAWYGLVVPDKATEWQIVKMEFKRFLLSYIFIPCQLITGGRRLKFRILTYTDQLRTFLNTYEAIRSLWIT
jgi:hypothetical protein